MDGSGTCAPYWTTPCPVASIQYSAARLVLEAEVDIFDLNELLAQLILALGAALVIGNVYALIQDRRGVRPKGIDGELHRGRAWWLIAVGAVITVWALASLLAS